MMDQFFYFDRGIGTQRFLCVWDQIAPVRFGHIVAVLP